MDLPTGKLVTGAISAFLKKVDTQSKFEEAKQRVYEDWIADIQAHLRDVEGAVSDNQERVEQFTRTVLRFAPEALGSVSAESRSMLAYAAAQVAVSDVPAETKARIVRALDQLEAEDLHYLNDMRTRTLLEAIQKRKLRAAIHGPLPPEHDLREFALIQAGLLRDSETAPVTDLGRTVLRFMAGWLKIAPQDV